MKLNIEQYGDGPISLVFFHGWGFDSQIWTPILPQLTPHFTSYLVDLPGFGYSDMMSWETFKKNLCQQLPDKFITVGWSLGGAYAIRLAIEEPQNVMRFISVAASPRYIADKDWPGITKEAFDAFMVQFLNDPEKTLHTFLQLQAPHRAHLKIGKMASIQGLNAGLTVLKTWDLREPLNKIRQGNFVFGRLDAIVPARTDEVIRTRYSQFDVLMLNQAAHMPFLSHTKLFVDYLCSVLM